MSRGTNPSAITRFGKSMCILSIRVLTRRLDGEYVNEIMMPYDAEGRLVNYQVNVPYDGNVNPQVNVTYAGLGQIRQNDFIVRLPEELQGDIDEAGLRAMIDGYKIAGKEYEIVYCL